MSAIINRNKDQGEFVPFNSESIDPDFDFSDETELFVGEEFDSKDVINTLESKKSQDFENSENETPDLDVDSILNYSDEKRKSDGFEDTYIQEYGIKVSDPEHPETEFRDFLVYPNISGKTKGLGSKHIIPAELIDTTGRVIEISDDPMYSNKIRDHNSTVLINRNNLEEIESIEVICTCGTRTLIKLEPEDSVS